MGFLEKAGLIISATLFAKALMLLIHIASGRYLGAEAYGNFNLAMSIASFLILFSAAGLTITARKFIPKSKNKPKTLSTLMWMAVLWSLPVFALFSRWGFIVLERLHLPLFLILPAILLALFDNLREFTESFLYGLGKVRILAKNMVLAHIIAFIIFLALLFDKSTSPGFLIIAATYLVMYFSFALLSVKHWIHLIGMPDKKQIRPLALFGISCVLCAITGTILSNIDKFMVNFFMDVSQVGIYSAYFTVSTVPLAVLMVAFNKVLFSHIAESKAKFFEAYSKFKKSIKWNLFAFPMFALGTTILMWLYNFPIDRLLVTVFSILAILVLIEQVVMTFIYNIDNKAIWWISLVLMLGIIVNIILNWKLIPLLGVLGAAIATIVNLALPIIFGLIYLEKKCRWEQ